MIYNTRVVDRKNRKPYPGDLNDAEWKILEPCGDITIIIGKEP